MTIFYANTPLESLFQEACSSGNLELIKHLTTSSSKYVLDINCGFNYGLRTAASHGHIDIIEYLVSYPDASRRQEVLADIPSSISSCAQSGQIKSLEYFKSYFKKHYNRFFDSRNVNSTLDSLSMSGKLEAIEYMVSEARGVEDLNWGLFLQKTIQYGKKDCFDFFIQTIPATYFKETTPYIQDTKENILHTCLYNERFECLPSMARHIDISKDLSINHFNILLECKIKSLYHIIVEYNYHPHAILQQQIDEYLIKHHDKFAKDLKKIMNAIKCKKLNQKLSFELEEKNNLDKRKKL